MLFLSLPFAALNALFFLPFVRSRGAPLFFSSAARCVCTVQSLFPSLPALSARFLCRCVGGMVSVMRTQKESGKQKWKRCVTQNSNSAYSPGVLDELVC